MNEEIQKAQEKKSLMNGLIVFGWGFLVLFGFMTLSAGTTLSTRERKKNLDSRLKTLQEIDSALGGWNINESQARIPAIERKGEEIYREKSVNRQSRILSKLEEDLYHLQMDYAKKLERYSNELVESFTREFYLKRGDSLDKDLAKKEKVQRYFEMSKRENTSAEKYMRMKNPNLALLSFKRSIIYNFHAFLLTETELPSQYHPAFQNWMKTSPYFPKGKLADRGDLERNEN